VLSVPVETTSGAFAFVFGVVVVVLVLCLATGSCVPTASGSMSNKLVVISALVIVCVSLKRRMRQM
jgi:hypothetical protein